MPTEAPTEVSDEQGAPRFGSYQGELQSASLSPLRGAHQLSLPLRALKHKKWQYQLFTTNEVIVICSVADLGYTSNAFAVVVDLAQKKGVADVSFLGAPRGPLAQVNDQPGIGLRARFRVPGAKFEVERPAERYRTHVEVLGLPMIRPSLRLDAELLAAGAPPPWSVIAPVDGGVVNVTQKWAGLLSFGNVTVNGRRWVLDGGVGGADYTQGYLARHTRWRWAMGAGRLPSGDPIGFNLAEGFNDGRPDVSENAVWLHGKVHPVGRVAFRWNDHDLYDRWTIESDDGALRLRFRPLHLHRESRDLVVVKSYFAQPVGLFDGEFDVDGVTHTFTDVGGVTEDQDILW